MSEVDRKRGWWSRTFGADGATAEEALQELAQELTAAREMIDRIAQEREQLRETTTRRLEEQAAIVARVRAETEQIRRAAESQLGALRAQLETSRQEHAKERSILEQRQRDAHQAERESATKVASLQRDYGILAKELSAARQALAQEETRTQRALDVASSLRTELATSRRQCQELDAETADLRTSLLELRSRYEDLMSSQRKTLDAAQVLHAVGRQALDLGLGSAGAELALRMAWRGVPASTRHDTPNEQELRSAIGRALELKSL